MLGQGSPVSSCFLHGPPRTFYLSVAIGTHDSSKAEITPTMITITIQKKAIQTINELRPGSFQIENLTTKLHRRTYHHFITWYCFGSNNTYYVYIRKLRSLIQSFEFLESIQKIWRMLVSMDGRTYRPTCCWISSNVSVFGPASDTVRTAEVDLVHLPVHCSYIHNQCGMCVHLL